MGSDDHIIAFGDSADNVLTGGEVSDRLYGGAGRDTLNGGDGRDYIEGNAGEDMLNGGDENDTILGGSGNDTIIGGKGDDALSGGSGFDTYVYNSGDGSDVIKDKDGQIVYNSSPLNGGTFVSSRSRIVSGVTLTTVVYRSDDGAFTYLLKDQPPELGGESFESKNLFIYGPDNGLVIVKNFINENLGLTLADAPPVIDPNTPLTILGDLAPIDTNSTIPGVQTDTDALGNVLVGNPAATESNRADRLFDSAGNDRIIAGGGDGNDVILGGSESDVLVGGAGDDRIYADVQIDVGTAIDNGSNSRPTLKSIKYRPLRCIINKIFVNSNAQ